MSNVPAVIAGAGVVVGASLSGLLAWLVVRRTSSGKVATSTAADLWAAEQAFQTRILGEYDRMQGVIDVLRPALAAALAAGIVKDAEITRLRGELDIAEKALSDLRAEIKARS